MRVLLTSDGSRTVYCDEFRESFHSESGAFSEASFVYLQNSGLKRRLGDGLATSVLEIGLGTGLNFLLSADCALQNRTQLNYWGIDTSWMPADSFRELGYDVLLDTRPLFNAYQAFLEQGYVASDSQTEIQLPETHFPEKHFRFQEQVNLELCIGRAEQLLVDERFPNESVDCVYHDAFSPATCPELWTAGFLASLYRVLRPGGTLTTYCVKSQIRKRMQEIGFDVKGVPGPPGGKRQVMLASK